MAAFSDYAETNLLDHVLGTAAFTAPTGVFVALSSTAPADDGTGVTEPTFTGYARQAATFTAATQSGAGPGQAANTAALEYGDPDVDGSASHFAVYDAATLGNLLVHGALDGTVNWQAAIADPISFQAGDLVVELD